MSKFNIESEDSRYPLEIEYTQSRPYLSQCPPLQIQMTFRLREGLGAVEGVALMYYQFDKFMKEYYGSTVNAYQESQRKKRIE